MLNTQKLLYILPDVAYIAELLPGKKPTTFTIQAFRQINGEFLDDNEFLGENVLKLIQKLDPDTYHLILPDFLFTSTIVSIQEKSDTKIKAHLKDRLLPELEITPDTHFIDTTILTEHGDSTKVQLSALEKSILLPIQIAVEQTKVKISGISPLSWTVKSFVSLEPSISVVQMGTMLYTALHYIGVDQCTQANVDEVENIFETIRTLKGAEPSIQTVYLLSNDLVEEKLKEHLSDTLPIQQLASHSDDDSKMPSYVQKTIEAGMRTLSIEEYPVPKFEVGKAPAGASLPTRAESLDEADSEEETVGDLPKPSAIPTPIAVAAVPEIELAAEDAKLEAEIEEMEPALQSEIAKPTQGDDIDELLESLQTDEEETIAAPTPVKVTPEETITETPVAKPVTTPTTSTTIKNNNRTRTMLKMVFVTLAVFFATVGVGIGLGLGVLQLSQVKEPKQTSPIVEATPIPAPTTVPSPSPSPTPTIVKADLAILVVNATTKAGYAGQIGNKLESAEFGEVKAGNAKGEYEEGNFVLMETENTALIAELEEATGLELVFQADATAEDPRGDYDAVLVLAE